MKLLAAILVLLGAVHMAGAQGIALEGTVKGKSGPVASATVTILPLKKTVVTDSAGHFIMHQLPEGKYRLLVSAVDHEKTVRDIILKKPATTAEIVLTASEKIMNEVVVSGTMKAISKMDSPIPVEVYAPAYFKKNPSPNIFESLQMVNGIQPQLNCNVCNTGDIHINGMEGPYTMILIDGMPIVSSLSTVYGLAGIPNSMIKRVEIVKGPASTLYGSEAVGGLVNIITKDAGTSEKLKLDISATSVGEYNADITAAAGNKKAAALIGINYFNYRQRRDINNDNFTDVTLQQRLSVFNKWNFKRKNQLPASLALRYVNEDRWGGELQWTSAAKGSNSIYGESVITNRAEIIGVAGISKNLETDISYNYHLQDSYYGTVKYYAVQQVLFAQARWTQTAGKHSLLAGLPLRYTFYDDNSPATASINGDNKSMHAWLPGIFLQDEFRPSRKLTVLAGIRYDHHNEHGSIVTPRLSFKYAPDPNTTFRLSAGNGYRVVNLFTEDHAALTGARDVVIAAALKPERSWNGNINGTKIIRHRNGHISLDGSVFYTYFSNKITGDFIADPHKIIYDNLDGHAVSKGITLNTDFNFTGGLKINAGATLMDVYTVNKNAAGKKETLPQLFAPRFSGTYAVSYTFYGPRITADLTGKLNGPMFLPVVPNDYRPEKSPCYHIVNLQLTKTFSGGIELYGGVKNLLNFLPKNPILHADDPFDKPGGKYFDANGVARQDTNPNGYTFDPSYNYASMQGMKAYAGIRWQIK
ncbi:MAG: TonB-dependent receptor [Ferruginibacter sp.]